MAISVGFSRSDNGRPTMREKAYPDSEIVFAEDGPSKVEEALASGSFVDGPMADIESPQRRYSHSSADLK